MPNLTFHYRVPAVTSSGGDVDPGMLVDGEWVTCHVKPPGTSVVSYDGEFFTLEVPAVCSRCKGTGQHRKWPVNDYDENLTVEQLRARWGEMTTCLTCDGDVSKKPPGWAENEVPK